MKKVLSIVLVVALVMGMSAVTALAAEPPTASGAVRGIITDDPANPGYFSGYVDGDYYLEIEGHFTSNFVSQHATFAGTVTGDFDGTITAGLYCLNGLDSMYAVITVPDATQTVRIQGAFLQSGIAGDFAGEIIVGDEPSAVTSLAIQSPSATMSVGTSMQMSAVTNPAGSYDVLWSVWMNGADVSEYAWIDQSGVLHALKPGVVTVIANTLDPSLATTTKNITIVDPSTVVTAGVDPTYTIIIPTSVDFGTLVKDGSTVTKDFNVTAQDVVISDNATIDVSVTSGFVMGDGYGNELPYTLSNETVDVESGDTFASFTATTPADGTENGQVSVDTDDISVAGSYSGTMVFTITYND